MISKSLARDLIKVNKLFKGVPEDKLKLKTKGKTLFELDTGESILQDHDASQDIFLILKGSVRIGFDNETLGKREFTFFSGEFISPNDFSDQTNIITFSEATENSTLFRLDKEVFDDIAKSFNRVRENLEEFNTDLQNRIAMKQFEAMEQMESRDDLIEQGTEQANSKGSGFSFDEDFDTTLDDIDMDEVQAELQLNEPEQIKTDDESVSQSESPVDEVSVNMNDNFDAEIPDDSGFDTTNSDDLFADSNDEQQNEESSDLLGSLDDANEDDTSYLDDLTSEFDDTDSEQSENKPGIDTGDSGVQPDEKLDEFIEKFSQFLLSNFHETLANIITFSNILTKLDLSNEHKTKLKAISDNTKNTIDIVNKVLAQWLDDEAKNIDFSGLDASERMRLLAGPIERVKHGLTKPIDNILHIVDEVAAALPDNAKNVHQLLEQQTKSLSRFINLLISYLNDNITIDSTMYQLNETLDSILSRLAEYASGRDVKLLKRYDKDIGVLFDPEDFYSACFQITKNACEAMPKGGRLLVSTHIHNDTAIIRFKDSGPGIDPNIRETLFKPFITSGKDDHLGLGLPLAKKIISDLSGNLQLGTQDDRGATFDITLTTF